MDSGGRLEAWKRFFFTTEDCFLTTMRARQAAAPRQARLEACSLDHLQEGVQEVVKKHIFCCEKKPFWRSSVSLNGLGGRFEACIFFTTEKVFSLQCVPGWLQPPGRPGSRPVAWTTCRRGCKK